MEETTGGFDGRHMAGVDGWSFGTSKLRVDSFSLHSPQQQAFGFDEHIWFHCRWVWQSIS